MKLNEIDMIVPVHFVNWNFFPSNVESWLKEIPLKTLYFGCNNPNKEYRKELREYLSSYDKIKFIDQSKFKTLGMQLADLMKKTTTEWFVYCHGDVQLLEYSFLVMSKYIDKDVGIIESDRIQYDYEGKYNYPTVYPHNAYRERSFSGYQLIRKKAIESILDKIEDDFIYRNEDIIFQNICENNGFKYIKPLMPLHIHTTSKINHKWTPQGVECENAEAITYDMQSKGIIKYCSPNDITMKAWRAGFGGCIRHNNENIFDFIENFVKKVNPVWIEAIQEIMMDLIVGIYK